MENKPWDQAGLVEQIIQGVSQERYKACAIEGRRKIEKAMPVTEIPGVEKAKELTPVQQMQMAASKPIIVEEPEPESESGEEELSEENG